MVFNSDPKARDEMKQPVAGILRVFNILAILSDIKIYEDSLFINYSLIIIYYLFFFFAVSFSLILVQFDI